MEIKRHSIEVIAELGINHCGNASLIRDMIHAAKECGADTAKFQLYDPRKLFGDPPREPAKFSERDWQAIYDSRLTRRQLYWIKQECETVGLRFLASVFDEGRLGWLEEVGVDRYKIASVTASDDPLLCKAIADTGKPILISDGKIGKLMWGEQMRLIGAQKWGLPSWLYCISDYPTSLNRLEFHTENRVFHDDYNVFSSGEYEGFSDHTMGTSAAVVAMSLGAKIIEKHFTLDRTLPGPDQVCSADPDELTQICRFRDDVEKILYKD